MSDRLAIRVVSIAILAVLIALLTRTEADPDLWGHLAAGRLTVTSGLAHHDPFSFTSDRPWMNHGWLGEVTMYGAWAGGGSSGLVALKLAVMLVPLVIVVLALRRAGLAGPTRDLLVFLWVVGVFATTQAVRPQLFSVALFAVLLVLLSAATRGRRVALLGVPPLMLLWANLHGAWVVGFGALAAWGISEFHEHRGQGAGSARAAVAAVVAASVVATLCTPYGRGLWYFLWESVGPHDDLSEWRPLWDTSTSGWIVWLALVGAAGLGLVGAGARASPFAWLVVLGLAAASFRVQRLGAFFATSVLVLLAPGLARVAARRRRRTAPGRPSSPVGRLLVVVLAVAVFSGAVTVIARQADCIRMDYEWGPDTEALAFIRSNGLRGRMITWFDWGQYALWHLAPGVRVSFDGRHVNVYSEETRAAHRNLYVAGPGWRKYLAHLAPDYIWLPTRLPVTRELRPPDWTVLFQSPLSVVLGRQPAVAMIQPPAHERPACFPGDPG